MRLYLEELRSKIGLNSVEMDKRLYGLTGTKLKCRTIETGHYWSEITPERAQILANAYQTTPEKILALELAEGKWEGRNYFGVSTQKYDASIYDKALTIEEKEIAERLFEWLQRVISHMKYDRYSSYVRENIVSLEDIEESAYIGFLRGIKALTKTKETDVDYISTLDDYAIECYEKWYLRRKIYTAVRAEIDKANSQKRRGYTYAKRLEGGLSEGADIDDDSDLYEFIPDRSLSVERRAESSCMLSMLYKHLTVKQIEICSLLIEGYSKKYLICTKAASPSDIGIITFYLQQIIRYGKVRWEESGYVSGSANVRYNFPDNMWVVTMSYEGRRYSLGLYEDLNIALDVQVVANALRASGEFVSWYERHLLYNHLTGTNTFTYPLPGDEEEYSELCNRDVRRIFKKSASVDATYGVRFLKKHNSYEVCYGADKIGRTKTFEEGLALRKTAEEMDRLGEYDKWLAELRFKKHNPKRPNATIRPDKRRGGYTVSRYIPENKKEVYIGLFKTLEEAEKIRDEINDAVQNGKFAEWHTSYKEKRGIIEPRDDGLILTRIIQTTRDKKTRYEVVRSIKGRCHPLLVFATESKQEAEKMSELANAHILVGDFETWSNEVRAKAKRDRYSVYAPAHIYKSTYNTGVYYNVCWTNQYKTYTIASRRDKKEAESILLLTNQHIKDGDIFEWMETYKSKQREARSETYARIHRSNGAFKVSRYYQGKMLYVMSSKSKEEAEKALALANEHIKEGDFDEWLERYKEEHKTELSDAAANTFARIHRWQGLYKVSRYQRGKEYYVAAFSERSEAERIQAIANEHIEAGDFEEWREQYRASRPAGTNKVKQRKVQWCYAMVDFAASADNCYRVVCYDECDSTCIILATQDVDEAYNVMNLANEHIEIGDYDAWFDEYKSRKDDIYG